VAQARAFAARVVQLPDAVLSAPVSLNIVCFRFAPAAMTPEAQDALNKEILLRVQESGLAIVSGSKIGGRYVIRVACSNHRSTWDDFEAFLAGIARIRGEVARG
jgi:glutamate/tyrosine decarboxylase-like PLP-dependent enzyme